MQKKLRVRMRWSTLIHYVNCMKRVKLPFSLKFFKKKTDIFYLKKILVVH